MHSVLEIIDRVFQGVILNLNLQVLCYTFIKAPYTSSHAGGWYPTIEHSTMRFASERWRFSGTPKEKPAATYCPCSYVSIKLTERK